MDQTTYALTRKGVLSSSGFYLALDQVPDKAGVLFLDGSLSHQLIIQTLLSDDISKENI